MVSTLDIMTKMVFFSPGNVALGTLSTEISTFFDRDARRSGLTNYFVGFQNPRFTKKCIRNALDRIR